MNLDSPRSHRRLLWVAAMIGCLWAVATGCDDDSEESSSTQVEDDEPRDDTDGQADEYVDAKSAYDEFADVDPIEPKDLGPEAGAIYFASGLKGYTEPCGCTVDVLLGGIDRITAFVDDARQLHPDAVFVDAGDWLFESTRIPEHLRPQEKAKAEVLAAAHRQMDTLFSVPGGRDLAVGADFYFEMMERADIEPLGANITIDGRSLEATKKVEIDGQKVLFVGAGEADTYEDVGEVEVTDEVDAIEEAIDGILAQATVVVYQGSPLRAEVIAEELTDVDFVIVGHDPRRKDDATPVGETTLLEAYDQGRYLGRLKLYGDRGDGAFVDGRAGIRAERQTLDEQIRQVRLDLRRLEVRTDGEDTPMVERLEERLEGLEDRRRTLMRDEIDIAEQQPSFLYDLIAMEPGYRMDDEIRQRRHEYNRSLAELNRDIDRDIIPADDDQPVYVGQKECQTCHGDAYQFWEDTAHASAVETLEVRHKDYDQNCIGCHVDGWEQPGGSVLGKLEYADDVHGETIEKDLAEVGCESCHGPGSKHRIDPLDDDGEPQHITRHPTENDCVQCHVPDHSPSFDFDVFVEQVTGKGHQLSESE